MTKAEVRVCRAMIQREWEALLLLLLLLLLLSHFSRV